MERRVGELQVEHGEEKEEEEEEEEENGAKVFRERAKRSAMIKPMSFQNHAHFPGVSQRRRRAAACVARLQCTQGGVKSQNMLNRFGP